jgi:hypothetical protein
MTPYLLSMVPYVVQSPLSGSSAKQEFTAVLKFTFDTGSRAKHEFGALLKEEGQRK